MNSQLKFEIEKQVQISKNIIMNALKQGSLKPSHMSLLTKFRDIKMAYVYAVTVKKYNNSNEPLSYYFKEGYALGYEACAKHIRHILSKEDYRLLISSSLIGVDISLEILAIPIVKAMIPDKLGDLVYKFVYGILSIISKKYELSPDVVVEQIATNIQKRYQNFSKQHAYNNAVSIFGSYKTNLGKLMIAYGIVPVIAEQTSKEIAIKLGISMYFLKLMLIVEIGSYLISTRNIKEAIKGKLPAIIIHISTTLMQENPHLRKYAYLLHSVINVIAVALAPYHIVSRA